MNNKVKVLIVDDSLVFCKFLSENLPKENPSIEVVGYAMNAYDALRKIPQLNPDVISLDVEMPKLSGIDFLKELLPKYPLPVILVSSLNVSVFDALSNGAVDFVKKPDMSKNYGAQVFVRNLASKLCIVSNAKVRLPQHIQPIPMTAAVPSSPVLSLTDASSLKLNSEIIALGASTGGTEATLQILQQLPADIPGIVITQHMPEGFTKMYAERLNRLCKMEVREAVSGDRVERGVALIAPGGDLHMKVVKMGTGYTVSCYPAEKVNGHRPSVDILFHSVAQTARANAVGIILTGMGSDGAKGLLAMKQAGAYTIGQDKDSCVVYGMPMVAHQLGGVSVQASCSSIPNILLSYLSKL